jgi:hypothetical protein
MSQRLYDIAAKVNSGQLQTEMGLFPTIGIVLPMAVFYFITASTGLNRMKECDGVDAQFRKYTETALVVAATIPSVLLLQKIIRKDVAAYMMIYGIAGAVTAGSMTGVLEKCEGNETEKTYNGFYLTGFGVVFLMGLLAFFFIR